jgi:hypothetical protein
MAARLALSLVVLALAAPAAAFAQTDPFAPLPPAPQEQPAQPVRTVADTTDDGGLDRWQEILIFAGGGILLVGIGWAIVADARKNAPVEQGQGVASAKAAHEADRHRRKQVARERAKRARAARKRNR